MASLTDPEFRAFLKDEYLLLQDQHEDFDRRTLTIKGWIGTGAFAALAVAFSSSYKYAYILPCWWQSWPAYSGISRHTGSYFNRLARIRIIEAYFREDPKIFEKNSVPFQAYHRFYLSYQPDEPIYEYEKKEKGRPRSKSRRLGELAGQGFVCQPYLTIIVLGIAFFIVLLTRT
jgi:hypothetical protein